MRRTPHGVVSTRLAGAAVAALIASHALGQDVIRCRTGRLVNVGMKSAELIARCGEPKSRTVEEVPIFRRNANGTRAPTGDFTRIERWTFERGQGQFDALLTIEEGELVGIELLTDP